MRTSDYHESTAVKKIVFITLILLGSSVSVFAQNLKVTDFKRTSDLSAVRFPVEDINGVPCGLIKVWLPLPDAHFVGNVMKSVYKNGEWWVYMTNNSKRIKVKTTKYSPLSFDFPEPIQGKVTYVMSIEEPRKDNGKTPRVSKCKPEKFTMELSANGGCDLGVALDFTASYFLIGLGVDWMILAPERTVTTSLANSGYTGNFTKTTTTSLSGSRANVFLDIGTYFKYFSLSCQVGLLCGTTIDRASLYDGWGYGLVDDDLNEYWGSYEHRSFSNTTSDKELHLTITPQVKGYIPVNGKNISSLSIGLGYIIIPSINYNPGLSCSLGVHFRY